MDRCPACGAALAPAAAWCGQCFASTTRAARAPALSPVATAVAVPGRAFTPAPAGQEPLVRRTRWGKTPTTFGPVGRVVATILVLIPLLIMGYGGLALPMVWGGAGLYLAVVVPWAMRDIWKAGILRLG